MPVDYFTYDGDPGNGVDPHRPSIDDLGTDTLEDFPGEPVDPRYGVNSEAENQRNRVGAALAKTTAPLELSVRFSAGAPFIYKNVQLRTTSATITVTDNGTGDTSLTWPANSFPAQILEPGGCINGDTVGMIAIESITNGVRVRTLSSAGAAADLPFTCWIK